MISLLLESYGIGCKLGFKSLDLQRKYSLRCKFVKVMSVSVALLSLLG
jgi:hypothetical protein